MKITKMSDVELRQYVYAHIVSGADAPIVVPGADDVPDTSDKRPEDIDAMQKMLGIKPETEHTEVHPAEPVPAVEPATKPDVPTTEVPPVVPVVPAAEPAAKPETDLERALRTNEDLRTLINEMARSGITADGRPAQVVPPVPAVAPAPGSSPAAAVAVDVPKPENYESIIKILGPDALKDFSADMKKDIPFLTKEQLDVIVDKPELLIPALNEVRRQTMAGALNIIPTIVAAMVESYGNVQRTVEDFYSTNKDLNPHRDYTRLVFNQTVAANKEKPMTEVLALTAKETRKRLGLAEPVAPVTAAVNKGKKPNFPAARTSGGRTVQARTEQSTEKTQQDYMAETLRPTN